MGKGKRNRENTKSRPKPLPRAIPEMAANTPDSFDDIPHPGTLSDATRDRIAPEAEARGLLNCYIQLALVLEEHSEYPVPAEVSAHDPVLTRRLVELITAMQPAEVHGARDDAAYLISRVKPRWRGRVVDKILAEPRAWLVESRCEPDLPTWFAGAQAFVPWMVMPEHRDDALALLDYDAVVAEAERITADPAFPAGMSAPAFSLEAPESSVWFSLAMGKHPVAMIHAAACLALWIHIAPGATLNVKEKRIELAKRGLEWAELVERGGRGRNPNQPEAPEPAWTPPWATATRSRKRMPWDDPAEPTGEHIEVIYDGPAMTSWTAAYTWAAVITNLPDLPHGVDLTGDAAGDSPARAILARAITINARELGLLDGGLVDGPGVLSSMSVPMVMLARFEPTPKALIEFMKKDRGCHPTPGEPGYQAHARVCDMIRGGVTPEDALADKQPLAEMNQLGDNLLAEEQKARGAIVHTVGRLTPPGTHDLMFSQVGGYLNDYLRSWSPPNQDTQFRAALEYVVGWPDGNVPAGLLASEGPWYKVGFGPGPRNPERPAAWCRWLVQRGWATEYGGEGCWLALPAEWADQVRILAMDMGCASSAMFQWDSWTNGAETQPSAEFLRERYGQPTA